MAIDIEIVPEATDLTLLATVKEELGITGSSEDTRLANLITRASREVEEFTSRKFALAEVTEKLSGTTRLRLMLSRTPIASIISITLDGTLVTATDYKLEDREIGFVFDDSGWGSELVDVPAIARSRSSQPGDLVWAVRYRGGYYLPSFSKLTGVVSGATQANPVVITATAHALATGDRVELAAIVGMTELNRRRFTITVIDANSYSLDSEDGTTHTSYSSGGTWASTPQLPGDLEQIVIDLIRTRRAMKARDPSIKSERLGDWSVTYEMGASGLPLSIEKRLLAYQSMSP